MNAAQVVIDVYRALHEAAPGSDAGQRFLRDVSSWAVFSLMARLCRPEKPSKESERDALGLASIAGLFARGAGRDWLDEQVENTKRSLTSPSVREKAATAEDEFARSILTEDDLRAARRLQEKGARTIATRNAAYVDGAATEFAAYMNASGTFNRGQPLVAHFRPDTLQRFHDKLKKSLNGLPAAMYAFGEPTAAAEVRAWLQSGGADKLLDSAAPAFDDDWMAEHEIASAAAEEEANFARHSHELDSVRSEIMARNRDPERYDAHLREQLTALSA